MMNKTLRVLFVLKEPLMHERMGIMCLSAVLKQAGHETRLIFSDNLGTRRIRKTMETFRPEVLGYSVMTGEHRKMLKLNRDLKEEFNFFSVFGGPHATFFPTLINEEGVDAACVGEGDISFPEFCNRVAEGREFWNTPNFLCKYRGKIVQNPLLPLVENLDNLPFPDRKIMYEADQSLYNEGHKMFFSSRGCPHRCTYCFNDRYNQIYQDKGPVIRYRSTSSLIEEISEVKKQYPLSVVWIDDDNFLAKPKEWFYDFRRLYAERIRLPLSINARADFVNNENISLLKDAGLDSVWMGVECGNQDISKSILSRDISNDQIIAAASIIQKSGIKLITQNLIGLPVGGSYGIDLETLDFNIRIKPTFAWSSILYPYPGTAIESFARANGLLKDKTPFLETNKRSTIFRFSRKEVKKVNNLHKLFGLIVRFPYMRGFAAFLCSLPLGILYTMVFYLWYGYNIKSKIYPFLSLKKELPNYICLWWRFIKKT